MPNTYVNKVIINGVTKIDLTADDVLLSDVLLGKKFHLPSGESAIGTCTYDADTSDANATATEILLGKTAYINGSKVTGTMPNNGAVTGSLDTVAGEYTVPQGYHDGSGKVGISLVEQAKIIASNIKSGVIILGVTGTYSGESVTAQAKSATPTFSSQTILPDAGYDYLSQVTVGAIPVTYVDNASGGQTCTVG